MGKIESFFSDEPEIEVTGRRSRVQRIGLGQVFTPYAIAKCMAQWVSARKSPITLLDPAMGMGVFLRCLLEDEKNSGCKMTGYEIDAETIQAAKLLFASFGYAQLDFRHTNFLTANWDEKFDAILCNPPYRKFRGLAAKDEMVAVVERHTGIKISRAANLYVYFLIKLIWQLAEGGRAAVILPFEFLNADYGGPVKQWMLDQEILRKVLVLGEALQPFDDVITTACILCLERSPQVALPEVVTIDSLEELTAIAANFKNEDISNNPTDGKKRQIRKAGEKWHVSVQPHTTEGGVHLVPLSTFGRVMRGIATGDNSFFVITEDQREQYDLFESCVLPCLAKSNFAPDHVFAMDDFSELITRQKPVWLVNLQGAEESPAVQRYIQIGKERGSDQRFLTGKRSPWYALEKRPPAPLLVTTFSRGQVRWVRNRAGVHNLTSFHGFYPNEGVDLELLCAYLITPMAQRVL
ncbi:methyltransferase domain-containing protein, partial [bacterium]|nr:methyltransferase domain-containing protein [bacterium]